MPFKDDFKNVTILLTSNTYCWCVVSCVKRPMQCTNVFRRQHCIAARHIQAYRSDFASVLITSHYCNSRCMDNLRPDRAVGRKVANGGFCAKQFGQEIQVPLGACACTFGLVYLDFLVIHDLPLSRVTHAMYMLERISERLPTLSPFVLLPHNSANAAACIV